MSLWSEVAERLRALVFRAREEREMAEELRFHLDMAGAQHGARQARLAFGSVENTKEMIRDARGTRLIDDTVADFRRSVRAIRHAPRFTVVAILTLAIGIGGTTAVFSAVYAVLLTPLPYTRPAQLVRLYQSEVDDPNMRNFVTPVHFREYRAQLTSFAAAAAIYTYNVVGADIDLGTGPERIRLLPVSAGYFATLGAPPIAGRAFEMREETGTHVVIVSDAFWRGRLRENPHAVGRVLTMSGVPSTVVGVMPPGFRDPVAGAVDAWVPIDLAPNRETNSPGNHYLSVLGRLRPGVSIAQAQAELDALGLSLAIQYPTAKKTRARLIPLKADVVGSSTRPLELMLGAVALVLLLVCVNVTNLLLVRASERRREMALRAALGARRGRIVRQLLIESLTLALVGGIAGLAVARLGLAALVRLGAGSIPRLETVTLDPWMLAFALGVSSLCAVASGLVPALRAARSDPGAALHDETRGSSAGGAGRLRFGLVAAQVALAFVLLVGAGLLLASLTRLRHTPLGVTTEHVLTFGVTLPDALYDSTARARFYEAFAARVAALPGVRAAGGISRLPATGMFHQWGSRALTGPLAGTAGDQLQTQNRVVSGNYFIAAHIPVAEGRTFEARDDDRVANRIVISRATAEQLFPGVDPIGQRLTHNGSEVAAEVIGVVGDVAILPDGRTEPYVYHTHRQFAGERNWALAQVVLTDGPPLDAVPAVRRALAALDPRLVMDQPATLDDVIGHGSAERVFTMRILASFAALALALTAIGLFGILSYVVTLRRKEIGIRMALGADRGAIRAMVLRQGVAVTALGLVVGLLGAIAVSKLVASLLFNTSPLDPRVLVAAVLFMILVATAAAYFPVRRATAVDPRLALQGE